MTSWSRKTEVRTTPNVGAGDDGMVAGATANITEVFP